MLSICLPTINSIFPYQVDYPSQSFSSSLKYESDTNSQNDRTLIEGIEKRFYSSLNNEQKFLEGILDSDDELIEDEKVINSFFSLCTNKREWLVDLVNDIITNNKIAVAKKIISLLIDTSLEYKDETIGKLMLFSLNSNDWELQYEAVQLAQSYHKDSSMKESFKFIGNRIQNDNIRKYYFSGISR